MKMVKEMNRNRFLSSENALLAEMSFTSKQEKLYPSNGCHSEWSENMAINKVASRDIFDMVVTYYKLDVG